MGNVEYSNIKMGRDKWNGSTELLPLPLSLIAF